MRYINTKTGAVVDSSFSISGGDWVLEAAIKEKEVIEQEQQIIVEQQVIEQEEQVEEPPKQEPSNPTGASDHYDGITKAQIMQELDAFGVTYDKRANKQVLYDLMMAQGE